MQVTSYLLVLGINSLLPATQHGLIVLFLYCVPDFDRVGNGAVSQEGGVSAHQAWQASIFEEAGRGPSQTTRHVYFVTSRPRLSCSIQCIPPPCN